MNAKRYQDNTTLDDGLIDDSLSRAARQLHAAAVANVSAATQAQLHQRRRRALSGKAATAQDVATQRGTLQPLAWTGAFVVLALAIVLPMTMRSPQAPTASRVADAFATTTTTTTTATTATTPPSLGDTTIATLEEDPEMYVWLASSDAIALASE